LAGSFFFCVFVVLTAVQKRTYLATKIANFHGCKRETAALATMAKCIAPPPRKGSATPGCKKPQPALDPAPGLSGVSHFSCPKKAHRHVVADLDSHSHVVQPESEGSAFPPQKRRTDTTAACALPRAISRARGMTRLARDTGISRDGLYTALSPEGNPSFATILKVTRALGLTLHGGPLVGSHEGN